MRDSSDEIIFLEEIKSIKSEKETFCMKSEAKKRRNSSMNSSTTLDDDQERSFDDYMREPGTFLFKNPLFVFSFHFIFSELKKRSSESSETSVLDLELQTLRGRFEMFKRLKERADIWNTTPQKSNDSEPIKSNLFQTDYEMNLKRKRELKIEIRHEFVSEAIIEIHEESVVNLSESTANEIRVCCANLDTEKIEK